MNEQRVRDIIEALQKFDQNTRISTPVELKWNSTRTALQTCGVTTLSKAQDLKSDLAYAVNTLNELIQELE